MHASAAVALRFTDIMIVEIPKSQVSMLAKKGTTIVDRGVNSYFMSAVTLAPCAPDKCCSSEDYDINPGGKVNPPYLLTAPTPGDVTGGNISNDNDEEPNIAYFPSSFFFELLHVVGGA